MSVECYNRSFLFPDNDLNISLGDIVDELNVLEFDNPGLFRDLDAVLDQLTK